jgi:hypothetical protein
MRNKALACVLIACSAVWMSGCFLRFALATRVAESLSEEVDLIIDTIRTGATAAICQSDPFFSPFFQRCTYFVDGVQITSTVNLLTELGPFGAIIDPLVLELPAGTSVAGTFSGGGLSGDLLVYPNLSFVPIDDTRTFTPASGKQLVVLDVPPTLPTSEVDYDFDVVIRQTLPKGSLPTRAKIVATGRATTGGKTYYPPILPCVTNMSAVPTVELASSAAPQPITVPGPLTPCSNAVYTYFRAPIACDLDNDADVDGADVTLIMNQRNAAASPGDPRDVTRDAVINANDARYCTQRCTRAKCATPTATSRRRSS